ncbi:hypothetical protein [Commensalibacter nepenthis]|uniref:Uncharacterized protein n=1 Tax=Commensalibacter nepenthis TaxID=3043872 RepID=A0ABT6Q906_9PROT|nr:hypothetical protein [Commensalibacter sp. TBRC 10068]MDI2113395.1 hypothetical protein [Commensalibacter sp. TBRC 10068]
MFMVILFLVFISIILLLVKHKRSRHKKLITIAIMMLMVGMICWGYTDLIFALAPSPKSGNGYFFALVNKSWVWTIGMGFLMLSVPITLFCLFSKPKMLDETEKLLEDNNDLYG